MRAATSTRSPATARSHARPTSSWRNARASAQRRLGPRQLDLGVGALGQRLGRELRALALGEGDQLVDGSAGDAQADRCDAGGEQREVREVGQRDVDRRPAAPRLDRAVERHAHTVDGEVERTRSAQPGRVPGVVERHVGRLEPAQAERVVVALRAAEDPLAVLRATPPRPAPADRHAVIDDRTLAIRREHATGDDRRVVVDRPGAVGRQEQALRRRRGGDHRAPARRTVGAGDGLDGRQHRQRVGLRAAVGDRHGHAHQPGLDERVDGRLRQPAELLGLVGVGRHDLADRLGGGDEVAHEAPTRWASLQLSPCWTSTSWGSPSTRSAMMLRCTSPVPPPIVSARANR